MGSVYQRGRTWWLKYKDATGAWQPEATKAATKTEAKALLHEIERRVERQRLGLEPLSLNPEGWTVADLLGAAPGPYRLRRVHAQPPPRLARPVERADEELADVVDGARGERALHRLEELLDVAGADVLERLRRER